MNAWLGRALVAIIRFYRVALSPLLPPTCRYRPTCSRYAEEAVRRHGAGRGAWLALGRLLRCRPWGGRGWDPVPPLRSEGPKAEPPSAPDAMGKGA